MLGENNTVKSKASEILKDLRYNSKREGPFTSDIQIDFLQYLIDDFFDKNVGYENGRAEVYFDGPRVNFENAFAVSNKELINSLKRDGYIINGKTIKKLLPAEIEEAKTESELFTSLDKYSFSVSKGH